MTNKQNIRIQTTPELSQSQKQVLLQVAQRRRALVGRDALTLRGGLHNFRLQVRSASARRLRCLNSSCSRMAAWVISNLRIDFYENVSRARMERRELALGEKDENVVLEFRPDAGEPMLVACLWSHWTGAGQPDLLSFAAITDKPPPEVSNAGHDRCIVPIKPANVDAWLNPSPDNLARQFEILDDRERPYYAHRLAA